MRLVHKYNVDKNDYGYNEYYCELTDELDKQSEMDRRRHYILADKTAVVNKMFPIRVPGGTIGGIWLDENNVIKDIVIATDYIVKTYPKNINDLMLRQFVGTEMEWN